MLKQRILTRLTRFGLSLYVMSFCMTATVCAEENPLKDLAAPQIVSDGYEVSAGASTDAEEGLVPEEDIDEVIVDDAWDLPSVADFEEDGDAEEVMEDEPAVPVASPVIPTGTPVMPTGPAAPSPVPYEIEADDSLGAGISSVTPPPFIIPTPQVRVKELRLNYHDIVTYNDGNNPGVVLNASAITENNTVINGYRYAAGFVWEFLDERMEVMDEIPFTYDSFDEDGAVIQFDFSAIKTTDLVIYARCSFNNTYYGVNRYPEDLPSDLCRIRVLRTGKVNPPPFYNVSFPNPVADLEIYKFKNEIPITLGMNDYHYRPAPGPDEVTPVGGYTPYESSIVDATFDNETLNEYFTIRPAGQNADDGLKLYISMKHLDRNQTIMEMKNATSAINVTIRTGNGEESYDYVVTSDPLTLVFKDTLPSYQAKKVILNRYQTNIPDYSYYDSDWVPVEISEGKIAGCAENAVDPKNSEWVVKAKYSSGNLTLMPYLANMSKPGKKGKGTLILKVAPDYSEWNLPLEYAADLSIPYEIQDISPKLTLKKTSVTLNNLTKDAWAYIPYTVSAPFGLDMANLNFTFRVTDGKGKKECDSDFVKNHLNISWAGYSFSQGQGNFLVKLTGDVNPGSSYKIYAAAVNPSSGAKGKEQVITVKIAEKKQQDKPGVSVKTTGTIDASKYGTTMKIKMTGKNIELCKYGSPTFKILDGDVEMISCFGALSSYNASTGEITLIEYSRGTLLSSDKAAPKKYKFLGKKNKLKVYVEYDLKDGRKINGTASFTVKKSKIALKPMKKSYTITSKYDTTMCIPVKKVAVNSSYTSNYVVKANLTSGKKAVKDAVTNVALMSGEALASNMASTLMMLPGSYSPEDISSFTKYDYVMVQLNRALLRDGKSYKLELKPELYSGGVLPAKKTSITIKVPKSKKKPLGMSATASGSIDPLRDNTKVNVKLTVKNAEGMVSIGGDNMMKIYKSSKKGDDEDYTQFFNVTSDYIDAITASYTQSKTRMTYVIRRNTTCESLLPDGDYYLKYGQYVTEEGSETPREIIVKAKFKVSTKKIGDVSTDKKALSLYNQDPSKRDTFRVVPKDNKINPISGVEVSDPLFNAAVLSDNTVTFGYTYPGSTVTEQDGSPLTKPVTKKVKLIVHFEGSSKTASIDVNVNVNP